MLRQTAFARDRACRVVVYNSDGEVLNDFREWREGGFHAVTEVESWDSIVLMLGRAVLSVVSLEIQGEPFAALNEALKTVGPLPPVVSGKIPYSAVLAS